jgi:TetR/AcrR family tetracycline transcriptional repressor
MTAPTSGRQPPQATRPGLRRGSLTPERIVDASLELLDKQGVAGFSLPRLGRALGADPTAVYRHFASKDEMVLAIADRLIEEAMAGMEPRACWVDTVTEVTRRQRAVYLAHPAAASLSASRTTGGPAEMQAVNILIGAVLEAGFEGAEAVRIYRALGDFSLFWAGGEAGFLALDERAQATERVAWAAYLAVNRAEFPYIWRVRMDLPDVADDAIFDTILSLVVGGLVQRAPRPCVCGAHRPGPAASA